MPVRRRRKSQSWLERAGHQLWSAVVALLNALYRGVRDAIRATSTWLSLCSPWVRISVLVAIGLAVVVVWTRTTSSPISAGPTITDETEALARVIRSEAGIRPVVERVHVAWATRNLATSRDQTVAEMACSPCGPQERGRPVASGQEALSVDRELAKAVLASPSLADPTGGATHFINPAVQDRLAGKGVRGYRPYARIRRLWRKRYGWRPLYRLSPQLEMWAE
jgi:hypothetical protein